MAERAAPVIVQFNDGKPSLADIPGRLRVLADEIEAGEFDDVESLLVLIPQANDYPAMLGYGSIDGINNPLVTLEQAKVNFIINVMRRG